MQSRKLQTALALIFLILGAWYLLILLKNTA
jgi:hypothetical protein